MYYGGSERATGGFGVPGRLQQEYNSQVVSVPSPQWSPTCLLSRYVKGERDGGVSGGWGVFSSSKEYP